MAAFSVRVWQDTLQMMLAWIQANPNLSPDFSNPADSSISLLATDLNVGSLEVANLEALAMLMEDYDVRAQQAVNYAISECAYNTFGFAPAPAVQASGTVTFSAFNAPLSNVPIPIYFTVQTVDGLQFQTTAAVTLLAGTTSISAPVQAMVAGVGGNVPGSAIQTIVFPLAGVDAVVNAQGTWGGKDMESDASRAARFQTWVTNLEKGTVASLEYAALVVAPNCGTGFSVLSAYAVEPSTLVPASIGTAANAQFAGVTYAGLVWLYVDDGTSGGGSSWSALSTAVGIALNGGTDLQSNAVQPNKVAGMVVQVLPVTYDLVYASATVLLTLQGHGRESSITTAMNNAALAYLNSLGIGQTATYWAFLAALVAADPDILDISFLGIGLTASPTGTTDLILDPVINTGQRFVTQASTTYLNWSFV